MKRNPIVTRIQPLPARTRARSKQAASTEAGPTPEKLGLASEALKDAIARSLDDDKGENIVVVDHAGQSAVADFTIIATGRSARQVGAMAGHIVDRFQPQLAFPIRLEGMAQGDWVLLDCGDVIVHLFRPEVRAFYAIEKIWGLEPPVPGDGSRRTFGAVTP